MNGVGATMGRRNVSLIIAFIALMALAGTASAATEDTINEGTAWLASRQNPDGSWE